MRVGDLVKVYDFSHEARKRLAAKRRPGEETPMYSAEYVGGHCVGLIVASDGCTLKHRRVLRCADGDWEDYNVNRLEVINAGR